MDIVTSVKSVSRSTRIGTVLSYVASKKTRHGSVYRPGTRFRSSDYHVRGVFRPQNLASLVAVPATVI